MKEIITDINIEKINFPNKGIGFFDGTKVVVKNTVPGRKIKAKLYKKRSGHYEAEAIETLEKGVWETEKGCSHFELCGGCNYQTLCFDKEMEMKAQQVKDLLSQSGIEGYEFEGIVAADNITGYRNKCEFSFGDEEKGGNLALGMRKRKSYYEVITLKDCNIVDEDFLKIIDATLKFFRERNISFYHRRTHEGTLRHLVVRRGEYTGEILVNLVTASKYDFSEEEYRDVVLNCGTKGKITGILHTLNDTLADVVKNEEMHILYGENMFRDKLLGMEFNISAYSFFQTNTKGAEILYSIVKDFVGDTKDKVVFDLYCGTGTIGIIVSENAKKVVGIELIEEAVEAAKENASKNGVTNCEFIAGDVLKEVDALNDKPDVIVVDPPRDGIHPKAIHKIIGFGSKEIVYVSCKPTSLARDLEIFAENGYKVEKVKCVNQFPRTVHVETVCLLSKVDC